MADSSRKIPISVIVMTYNEEVNIRHCLEALQQFEQIFVVDSNSTDATVQIAKELGATVINFTWNGKYPKKKQWCLENLLFKHNWVFYVDADEIVPADLCAEIAYRIKNLNDVAGFYINGRPVVHGHVLHYGQKHKKLSLLDRHKCHFPQCDDLDVTRMWEVEGHYQPVVNGRTATLSNSLIHHDYKSLYAWFDRHNRYSDWEAKLGMRGELNKTYKKEASSRKFMKIVFNNIPLRPLMIFLYSYVIRLGFLDGRAGFDYAMMRAFYYWMIGIKAREMKLNV